MMHAPDLDLILQSAGSSILGGFEPPQPLLLAAPRFRTWGCCLLGPTSPLSHRRAQF
jgi:hypothetical protein